jgi:hypothetical protein
MDTLLPEIPLNYGALIKRSLLLYKVSIKSVLFLSILLSIIAFIPRFLSLAIGQDIFYDLGPLDVHRFWLLVIDIAGLIFFISILWRIHGIICQAHEPLREDLKIGIKKVAQVFVASLIQSTLVFGSTLLIFSILLVIKDYLVPSISYLHLVFFGLIFTAQFILLLYIYSLFIFLTPIIAIENKGIISALKRSVLLVWNHWWRTISVQITPWICYLATLVIMKSLLNINVHIFFAERSHHSLFITFCNMILFALFIPWVAALLLVQLKDLELRKNIFENAYQYK